MCHSINVELPSRYLFSGVELCGHVQPYLLTHLLTFFKEKVDPVDPRRAGIGATGLRASAQRPLAQLPGQRGRERRGGRPAPPDPRRVTD